MSSFWRSVHDLAATPDAALHMPGHGQRALPGGALPEVVYALDQSEMGGLDYLHEPTGPLLEAQARAARVFGADRTWFLVNGATVGNQAALWSLARPGGAVLVLRRSHQSVHAGIALAGLRPHYLDPLPDERRDGLFGLDLDAVRYALARVPDLVGVHVTSPDYYGHLLPLAELAALTHRAGLPLVVDEAHGAHLSQLGCGEGALAAGADLVVHSPHKALGSLTQSALLHVAGHRVEHERVSEALVLLQSSSPSALLTMSLDAVVEELDATGPAVWAGQVALAQAAAGAVDADGVALLSARQPLPAGVADVDPCKLLLDAHRYGLTGPTLAAELVGRGLRPEFADHRNVVLSVTRGTTFTDLDALLGTLRSLAASAATSPVRSTTPLPRWPVRPAERALDTRTALQSARQVVPLSCAAGRVVTSALTPYPPGIPLVLPGEVLDAERVALVQQLLRDGLTVRGLLVAADGTPGVRCAQDRPLHAVSA